MADVTIYATVHNASDNRNTIAGPYYADENNGVSFFTDNGADIQKSVTDDGGVTWAETEIAAGTVQRLRCFYDQEVPGDTGTIVHVAWLDSGTDDLFYVDVDAADGTTGTIRTVDSTITVSNTATLNRLCITKARGGNLHISGHTQSEIFGYKSNDQFDTDKTSINSPYELETQEDWCRMYPGDLTDDQDIAALFLDRSASELSIKMYDDSANTWTESVIVTMAASINQPHFDGAIEHAGGTLIVAAHNAFDTVTDDIVCYSITLDDIASPTITAKTNVVSNIAESAEIAVAIDNQTGGGDIHVAYLKGGVWQATVDVVFRISTDGGTTWGAEQVYSEAAADDCRVLAGSRTVTDLGGQVQFSWFNDDTNDMYCNPGNSLGKPAVTGEDPPRVVNFLSLSPLKSKRYG